MYFGCVKIEIGMRDFIGSCALLLASGIHAQLPSETIPSVESLEVPYPVAFALVHDIDDSKFSLVDTETRRLKGMLSAGQFATVDISIKRQKFYVGETVYSRGTRGTRLDFIAVYDFENMSLVGEIALLPKRSSAVVKAASTAITSDDQYMLVTNMNPATSVSVVDLEDEVVVAEVQTPGCSLVYPQTHGGFFSLCGNGGLVSITLDDKGQEQSRWASEPFNNIDDDPLSEAAELINDVWYFVSYQGVVQPIDVSGSKPNILPSWSLTTEAEADQNWRPAGWHGKAGHEDGLLWVAMLPDGYNGSHKDPATHIWLFSTKTAKRLETITLNVPAVSITATNGAQPQLLVVNIEGSLDVYDGRTGHFLRSISDLGNTPYMVYAL